MGLDYKLDLHSVGTGGQWWDVGDVIRFGLGSLFVLHLGKRETQCLREGPVLKSLRKEAVRTSKWYLSP